MAIIKGHSYSEYLEGTDGPADWIYGYGGADIIDARDGNDNIDGGAGSDLIFGGDGNDTISYLSYTPPPYVLGTKGVEVDLALGIGVSWGLDLNAPVETDTFVSIENVTGSNYNDFLAGDSGPNWLVGWGGDDQLVGKGGIDHLLGLDGDDWLVGGSGADTLDGTGGIDTADYGSSSAGVNVSLATGKGYFGDAEGDTLYDIENLAGSDHNDNLTGDGDNNVILGGKGDDFLKGGGGADEIDGQEGIDTVSYGDSPEGVYIQSDGFYEAWGVYGTATGDHLSNIENLTGSYHDDVLEGSWVVNTLKGLDGNDVLQGHEDADTLDGGDGSDFAIYGASDSGVTILLNNLGTGVGVGGDAEGDKLISIENLRGSNHNDTFMGNDDANVFEGLAGNDKLKGFGGADTLVGGAGADQMWGGPGADHFVWDAIDETGLKASAMDTVMDFDHAAQGDMIDLHDIDANGALAGSPEFTFIGQDNFSAPGQVRYSNNGVDTFIELNIDNIPVADALIQVSGLHTPDVSWFVF